MTTPKALRYGDSRTMTISNLVDAEGAPAFFASGDVVQLTIRDRVGGVKVLHLTSASDSIALDEGESTGTVTIAPGDWSGTNPIRPATCVYDLVLTRGGVRTTLDAGQVIVSPKVSPT